jgi:hypothetical protein
MNNADPDPGVAMPAKAGIHGLLAIRRAGLLIGVRRGLDAMSVP